MLVPMLVLLLLLMLVLTMTARVRIPIPMRETLREGRSVGCDVSRITQLNSTRSLAQTGIWLSSPFHHFHR